MYVLKKPFLYIFFKYGILLYAIFAKCNFRPAQLPNSFAPSLIRPDTELCLKKNNMKYGLCTFLKPPASIEDRKGRIFLCTCIQFFFQN